MEGWVGVWGKGWGCAELSGSGIHLQKGEAKDGKLCFTLAVCKLISACPHKDETSDFHLGRRQVSSSALELGEKIYSWLKKD